VAYADHFKLADNLIAHLTPAVAGIADPFIASRYSGFVAVTAVTVYELAVKEILCTFGESKHAVLGNFTRKYFDRINGRIKYRVLHEEYVLSFGDKYVRRFKKNVAKREKEILIANRKSILTSYDNIITWRHLFAHEGQIPTNATYAEAVDAYETGKEVIECLASSMKR
jgi:RiboL-PSP-HEPN